MMTHIPDGTTYNTTGSVIGPLAATQYRYAMSKRYVFHGFFQMNKENKTSSKAKQSITKPMHVLSCRYSGDFTDTGQLKSGQNNNGYVSNAADYSPPSQTTLLLRNGSSNTSSDTTYYPNGQVPSVNSTLTRNSRSTTVDSRQDVGLPNVHGSFNSLQNSILSEYTIHPLSYTWFACNAQNGHRIQFPFAE